MSTTLVPLQFRTELARSFHRGITNTLNIPDASLNSLTPLQNTIYMYTAAGGSTESFSGSDANGKTLAYMPGRLSVFKNGVKLNDGLNDPATSAQYIATTGTSVSVNSTSPGDDIIITPYDLFLYPNPSDYFYVFLGRTIPWDNDIIPPLPDDTRYTETETKRNILAVKRVEFSDVCLLARRINWDSSGNTVYIAYKDSIDLQNTDFYVLTTDYRIYKCLYTPKNVEGNYLPSTTMPSTTQLGPLGTNDGYIWQLIYEIPIADRIKFLTDDYIPIRYYTSSGNFDHNGVVDDITITAPGSGYTTAPSVSILGDGVGAVATATVTAGAVTGITITNHGYGYSYAYVVFGGPGTGAVATVTLKEADIPSVINQRVASYAQATAGAIDYIDIVDGGSGYGSSQIGIVGDGEDASAIPIIRATINGGVVVKAEIINQGKNYTFADISVNGSGSGALLQAVIGPEGGHGSNIPKELLSTVVGISVNIEGVVGDFFLDNDFRQLGIIKNIRDYNNENIFTSSSGNGCYVIKVNSPEKFNIDDEIITDTNGKYIVVYKNVDVIYLLPVIDSIFVTSIMTNTTIGENSLTIKSTSNNFFKPEFSHNTGNIIYLRNTLAVTRQSGQVEQIKIYFSF